MVKEEASQHGPRRIALLLGITASLAQASGCGPSPEPAAVVPPAPPTSPISSTGRTCQRIIEADVVALDQPFMFNRMGAGEPGGMIYALKSDVVSSDPMAYPGLQPGHVQLRKDKRPRPITLRADLGDCLQINFTNLLSPVVVAAARWPGSGSAGTGQAVDTLEAGVSVAGLDLVRVAADGGIVVGVDNEGATVKPGQSRVYTLFAAHEGTHLLTSSAAPFNSTVDSRGGQLTSGLFGAVNVEPAGAEWYRSQVTAADIAAASGGAKIPGTDYPKIDYAAAAAGKPILNMLRCLPQTEGPQHCTIVYSDLTAIITGKDRDFFPPPTGTCDPGGKLCDNPVVPNQTEPYREFTIIYHEDLGAVQAFPEFNGTLATVLTRGKDNFAINYGTGGIAAEIVANRGPSSSKEPGPPVGPAAQCSECKFEEFFLSSWAGGDPAMLVDVPANASTPTTKATTAYYADDPSNVYHSYINDRVIFRVLHGGATAHHVHHLHAHQWLFSAADDKSAYLDSQTIGPGSQYTMEIAHGGTGNRNRTPGDSIFHCHFYPHFAAGMWALWRAHDVFEAGTALDPDGRPAQGARALPDGEIERGTPIPAIVPLPKMAMPPMPGPVLLDPKDTRHVLTPGVDPKTGKGQNPGYPFYIPGEAGHRPPHPPLDFAKKDGQSLDGGLARHVVLSGHAKSTVSQTDFSKVNEWMYAERLPEEGTPAEAAAMAFHSKGSHDTRTPEGLEAKYKTNGKKPMSGAPYADPCGDWGVPFTGAQRFYEAADLQFDAVFNKSGWHYNQQRILSLWQDVKAYTARTRAPEPLFFRTNSNDCVTYWLTNLVPKDYEQDAFEVTTPTDVIGQHIHLVKFDVTASDGAENGFNYEDGTFSPGEVVERIAAMTKGCKGKKDCGLMLGQACLHVDPETNLCTEYGPRPVCTKVDPKTNTCIDHEPCKDVDPKTGSCKTTDDKLAPTGVGKGTPYDGVFGDPPMMPSPGGPDKKQVQQSWLGVQTTVQRWWADDVLDCAQNDRTLRTVFTHDHFGPSTHQQAGLYAGLVVEPKGSTWYKNTLAKGQMVPMYTRPDGGPTSWQAVVMTQPLAESYREFLLEFQDTTLTYGQPDKKGVQMPVGFSPVTSSCQTDKDCAPAQCDARTHLCVTPQIISSNLPGTSSVNYRNEPIPYRVSPPANVTPAPANADLAYAFSSIKRQDPALNQLEPPALTDPTRCKRDPGRQDTCIDYQPPPGVGEDDPYTPMLEAYQGDRVQVRTLVGAHQSLHNFSIHGMKWRFEPSAPDSGYRNSQAMGISEHFEMLIDVPPSTPSTSGATDYVYSPGGYDSALSNGQWGLFRAWQPGQATPQIPALPAGATSPGAGASFQVCENVDRRHDVTAVTASQISDFGTTGLTYYNRTTPEGITLNITTGGPIGAAQFKYQVGSGELSQVVTTGTWPYEVPGTATVAMFPYATYQKGDTYTISSTGAVSASGATPPAVTATVYGPTQAVTLTVTKEGPPGTAKLTYQVASGKPQDAGPLGVANTAAWSYLVPGTVTTVAFNPGNYETGSYVICPDNTIKPGTSPSVCTDNTIKPATGLLTITASLLQIADANAILYFLSEDLVPAPAAPPAPAYPAGPNTFKLAHPHPGRPVDPLVLRAAAGECVEVTLYNQVNPSAAVFTNGVNPPGAIGQDNNPPLISPSTQVGLHPQLVSFDATMSNGINAGNNPATTAAPGAPVKYRWYAGSVAMKGGTIERTPVELGAINLMPADPLEQHPHGAFGALIVEPAGSSWKEDAGGQHASATVFPPNGQPPFREFVAIVESDSSAGNGTTVNYGTEPLIQNRYGGVGWGSSQLAGGVDISCSLSNRLSLYWSPNANAYQSAPPVGNPQTPVFVAGVGMPARFRMLHAGADGQYTVTTLFGHGFQEEPYTNGSTAMGCNPLSPWTASRMGGNATQHFDMLVPRAGGEYGVHGDYLWRDFNSPDYDGGVWGIFRVTEPGKDAVTVTYNSVSLVMGANTVVMKIQPGQSAQYAPRVNLYMIGTDQQCDTKQPISSDPACAGADVDRETGVWQWPGPQCTTPPTTPHATLCAVSDGGGVGYWRQNTNPACDQVQPLHSRPLLSLKQELDDIGRLGLPRSVLGKAAVRALDKASKKASKPKLAKPKK